MADLRLPPRFDAPDDFEFPRNYAELTESSPATIGTILLLAEEACTGSAPCEEAVDVAFHYDLVDWSYPVYTPEPPDGYDGAWFASTMVRRCMPRYYELVEIVETKAGEILRMWPVDLATAGIENRRRFSAIWKEVTA